MAPSGMTVTMAVSCPLADTLGVPLNYLYIPERPGSLPPELREVLNEESQWSVNYNID